MSLFKIYKEMWYGDIKPFKKNYDEVNIGLWSKILFWYCCLKGYSKTTFNYCWNWSWSKLIPVMGLYYKILPTIKMYSPWAKAKVCLAWTKYIKSSWYRDRLVMMGERYAVESFMNRDAWFFCRKITRKEKWGIFFAPYSYIEKNRPWITCDF